MKQVLRNPPVEIGQVLLISAEGVSKTDLFFRINGYVVFLKGVHERYLHSKKLINVRIIKVNPSYGFAVMELEDNKDKHNEDYIKMRLDDGS